MFENLKTIAMVKKIFDSILKAFGLTRISGQKKELLSFLNWYDSDRVHPNKSWTNKEAVSKYINDKL